MYAVYQIFSSCGITDICLAGTHWNSLTTFLHSFFCRFWDILTMFMFRYLINISWTLGGSCVVCDCVFANCRWTVPELYIQHSNKNEACKIIQYWLKLANINPLNPKLNPICYLLALLGAHYFLHDSRIRVKSLTFRLLMSYIYGAPILDVSRSHTTTQHSR